MKISYTIESIKDKFILYSIVPTTFAGDAKNWIAEGSLERMIEIKEMLERQL